MGNILIEWFWAFSRVLDSFVSINVLLAINTSYLFSFRRYGRLILKKYDVFNSIQFILIVFWGKAWLCLAPEVTWHEYSNGIGSEFFGSPPDESSDWSPDVAGVTAIFKQECILVGCVSSAAVAISGRVGVGVSAQGDWGVGLGVVSAQGGSA